MCFASQVEISVLEQRITSMQQARATAAAEINRLLNRPVEGPLPNPAEVTPTAFVAPIETLQADLAATAPQIRSGEAMVAREQRKVEEIKMRIVFQEPGIISPFTLSLYHSDLSTQYCVGKISYDVLSREYFSSFLRNSDTSPIKLSE